MTPPLPIAAHDVVEPRYGRGALSDLLSAVCTALGADGFGPARGLPPASSYVVLLVDGMGYDLLAAHADAAPFLAARLGEPLTCGVPSTTATSIASFGTGLPPGGHGLVGYTSRIPGTDRLLDALAWDSQVDPRTYQPHPTLFGRAVGAGLHASVVGRRLFDESGLTVATQRGGRFVPAESRPDRIERVGELARRSGSLCYVYEGKLDGTGHRDGCESVAWRDQLSLVDDYAAELYDALPAGAVLVVTADHGMVDVPLADRVDADEQPALLAGVRVFGGEARLRHLYCEPGAAPGVAATWADALGERALVRTRDEAIDLGWFGPVEDRVRARLGDVIVASLTTAVMSRSRFPREAELVGLHGSLTRAEMLVPLITLSRWEPPPLRWPASARTAILARVRPE